MIFSGDARQSRPLTDIHHAVYRAGVGGMNCLLSWADLPWQAPTSCQSDPKNRFTDPF
ncbi:MAG: hypothetical protein SH821_06645 [Phototrophicales bacterium]|nr:hypothetical protein [Phototrophicales bacterium]